MEASFKTVQRSGGEEDDDDKISKLLAHAFEQDNET